MKDIFETQLYALELAEKRYKSPLSITVIKLKIQTFAYQKEPNNWNRQSFYEILNRCKKEIEKSLERPLRDISSGVELDPLAKK